MVDTSGIYILFFLLIFVGIMMLAILIAGIIIKHKTLKKNYGMNEYQVSKYFQEKSGFPVICRWLHLLELPVLILIIINRYIMPDIAELCDMFCVFVVSLNCIMRYKANKSKPITWWFEKN